MKRKVDQFEEVKVKMVMKLKKLTHRAAVEEIARMDAAKRQAAEEEAAQKARVAERREELRRRRGQSPNISRSEECDDLLSAEEFFEI